MPTPGDFLALVFNGPQDQTIDQVNWGTVNPNWPNYQRFQPFWNNAPAMPTDASRSLQRYPQGYDTDQPTDWVQLPVSAGQSAADLYAHVHGPARHRAPPPARPPPVTATATPTPFCGDAYEPDGLPTQAQPLDLGTEQTHTICPAADEDWYTISVVADKVYTLYTKDLGGGLDTILAVYTYPYDGTKICENDDAPRLPLLAARYRASRPRARTSCACATTAGWAGSAGSIRSASRATAGHGHQRHAHRDGHGQPAGADGHRDAGRVRRRV